MTHSVKQLAALITTRLLVSCGGGGGDCTLLCGSSPQLEGQPGVTVADFTGDGRSDVATTVSYGVNASGSVAIYTQAATGNGAFLPRKDYGAGTGPYSLVAADLNGDGRPDLANAGNPLVISSTSVYSNARSGGSPAIAVADVDGDGRNDLIVTDPDAQAAFVLLQDARAPGTFLAAARYALSNAGASLVVADVNGDGRPDIVSNFGPVSGLVNGIETRPPGVLFQSTTQTGAFAPISSLL